MEGVSVSGYTCIWEDGIKKDERVVHRDEKRIGILTSRLQLNASLNILGTRIHYCNAFRFALFIVLDPALPNIYIYAAV